MDRRQFLKTVLITTATAVSPVAPGLIVKTFAAATLQIIAPRFTNPTFIQPGGVVSVEVRAPASLDTAGWQATLSTDLGKRWTCIIEEVLNRTINNGLEEGWRLKLRIPSSIVPELMNLTISHNSANSVTVSKAISIVPDLEAPFYALHITDEHARRLLASNNTTPEDRRTGYRTFQLVEWGTPVVNLINPRMVLNTGDETTQFFSDGRLTTSDNLYPLYRNAKRDYRVPSIIIPGNHDIEHLPENEKATYYARWEKDLGQRYCAKRMGSLAIFAHDYTDSGSKQWMTDAYNRMWGDSSIKGRLFLQHFTDWNAITIPSDKPATLMLIGHLHYDAVRDTSPFPILMTIAAHIGVRSNLIEFKRNAAGNWTTNAQDSWHNFALVGNNGVPNLSTTFSATNDGTAKSNTVKVMNKISRRFPDGRVRFLMAPGTYRVSGDGKLLTQYTYTDSNGSHTAVLVQVDIEKSATKTINVAV